MAGNVSTWPSNICIVRESDGKKLYGGHMWLPSRPGDICPWCGESEPHTKGKEEYE